MNSNLKKMALIMTATAAYEQYGVFGHPNPGLNIPNGYIYSDKQNCQPKAQHKFTIKGINIMAASKKDVIKKYNHRKK